MKASGNRSVSKALSLTADQAAYWNEQAGPRWVAAQKRLDATFAPLTATLIDFAAPQASDRVLDIGCGCGATVLALASRARDVTGVDISKVMLDVARERVAQAGLANASLLLADAATHPFEPASFDLGFSRFGVMFFDDSVAAFAAIRRALRPGGRLAFITWRRFSENPWFLVPYLAVKALLPPQPPADPTAPGPFRFAEADTLRRVLGDAGFSAIELTRHDTTVPLAGPGEIDRAVQFAMEIGPVTRALAAGDEEARAAAPAAIREALRPHESAAGILLGISTWLVSARA